MEIRALEATDADSLRDLFFRLSPQTVYLRFFQPLRSPSREFLHHLADVDHHRREALAAVDDGGRIIAVARFDREVGDPTKAEIAVLVEDAWQGHGLGKQLLGLLAMRAAEEGVETLTATVLGENRRMLALTKTLAPTRRVSIDHGEWTLEIPVAPVGVVAA